MRWPPARTATWHAVIPSSLGSTLPGPSKKAPMLAKSPVLVTGASGGVGSTAVAILAARGYEVVGSTGSADAHDYLRELGAREIIDRSETSAAGERPLE